MRDIVFIADFANKKEGEVWLCDSQLASQLVNVEKVAEYAEPVEKEAKKKKK
jgi:hypothetical protein